jgi:hypothetical protein
LLKKKERKMHNIKTIEIEYQEIDTKIDALSVQWDSEYANWQNQVITSEKYEELNEMFNNQDVNCAENVRF